MRDKYDVHATSTVYVYCTCHARLVKSCMTLINSYIVQWIIAFWLYFRLYLAVNDIFRKRRTDSYIRSALFSVTTVQYYSTYSGVPVFTASAHWAGGIMRMCGSADVTTCKMRMLMRIKIHILPTRAYWSQHKFDLDSALKLPVLLWLSNELH